MCTEPGTVPSTAPRISMIRSTLATRAQTSPPNSRRSMSCAGSPWRWTPPWRLPPPTAEQPLPPLRPRVLHAAHTGPGGSGDPPDRAGRGGVHRPLRRAVLVAAVERAVSHALQADGDVPGGALRSRGRPVEFRRGPVRRVPTPGGTGLRARPRALAQARDQGGGGRALGVAAGGPLPRRSLPGAR